VAAPTAFTVLRACGAAYLLYLGVQALRSARRSGAIPAQADRAPVSGRYAYLRGFLTNLVNLNIRQFSGPVASFGECPTSPSGV
jgi:threonine/homoserine/homoserine lactone efflux protein